MMLTMKDTKKTAYRTCSDKTAKQVRSKNAEITRIRRENAGTSSDTLHKEAKGAKIIVRCILLLMQQNDNFHVEDKIFGS